MKVKPKREDYKTTEAYRQASAAYDRERKNNPAYRFLFGGAKETPPRRLRNRPWRDIGDITTPNEIIP